MKKNIILGALALTLAGSAQAATAVTSIDVGTNYLLAGWDFDGIVTYNQTNTGARYSDIYGDTNSVSSATAGKLWFNGTLGSDTFTTAQLTKPSSGQVNQVLDTRSPSIITDYIGSRTGGEGSISFTSMVEGTRDAVVFQVFNGTAAPAGSVAGFDNLYIDFESRINGVVLDAVSYTVNWFYSFDGTTFIDSGLDSIIDTSSNSAFTSNTVDFSSVEGMEVSGADAFYLRADVDFSGAFASRILNIDNVAFYGTAMAPIPEPSTYAMGLGVIGLAYAAYRRRKQQQA